MEDLLHKFQFQLTVSEMNKVMGVVFCFSFIKKNISCISIQISLHTKVTHTHVLQQPQYIQYI